MIAIPVRGALGSGKLAAGLLVASLTTAREGVGLVVVHLVLVVVVLVVPVVVPVVLHKAEVDRHLAHRAGHKPLRRPVASAPPSDRSRPYAPPFRQVPLGGHYLTIARLPPSNAVPTRTCVAPHAIACSRSPLIPADRTAASGWSRRRSRDIRANRANATEG